MRKRNKFGVPTSQFEYTKAAQRLKGLSPRENGVLVAITAFVCKHGGAFPSHATIANDTGYSKRTVRRAILDLERKGLIRRVPTSRAFQGNSTNYYAVVLSTGQPSGQHVQAIGQHVQISQDTESTLIRPLDQTKEEQGRLLLSTLEQHVFGELDEVIDFKRHPSLICLGSVSHWLFNGHTKEQFEAALIHLLEEIKHLNSNYLSEGKKLGNWRELVGRLKSTDERSAPGVCSNELHPICEEIWELLPALEQNHVRSRAYLSSLCVHQLGNKVIVTSSSKSANGYVLATCQRALLILAERHGYEFEVQP